jgi:regulator of protease activity HflC (stomatin/prohibitin superfamily)
MFLIVVALILLFVAFAFKNNLDASKAKLGHLLQKIAWALLIMGVITSMFRIIPAGSVGVQTLFGNVSYTALQSGINIVNPLASIEEFDARTQNYTMSMVHDEGNKEGDDAIRVLTKDGLEVILDVSVLYHIEATKAPVIFKTLGVNYTETFIRPISRTYIRDYAVYYDAVSLYSKDRSQFQNSIFKAITKEFAKRGFVLEQILVRNIVLPKSVQNAIEMKINAEQESQKMQFVLEKEAKEADRKRLEAKGIADYQSIINQSLSDRQIQYEQIKAYNELSKSNNAKVIIMQGKQPLMLNTGN